LHLFVFYISVEGHELCLAPEREAAVLEISTSKKVRRGCIIDRSHVWALSVVAEALSRAKGMSGPLA
jgi:hypothetical protein